MTDFMLMPVSALYSVMANHSLRSCRFFVGDYDSSRNILIDPHLLYNKNKNMRISECEETLFNKGVEKVVQTFLIAYSLLCDFKLNRIRMYYDKKQLDHINVQVHSTSNDSEHLFYFDNMDMLYNNYVCASLECEDFSGKPYHVIYGNPAYSDILNFDFHDKSLDEFQVELMYRSNNSVFQAYDGSPAEDKKCSFAPMCTVRTFLQIIFESIEKSEFKSPLMNAVSRSIGNKLSHVKFLPRIGGL